MILFLVWTKTRIHSFSIFQSSGFLPTLHIWDFDWRE